MSKLVYIYCQVYNFLLLLASLECLNQKTIEESFFSKYLSPALKPKYSLHYLPLDIVPPGKLKHFLISVLNLTICWFSSDNKFGLICKWRVLAYQVLSAPSYPWIFIASIPSVIKTFGFNGTLQSITKTDGCNFCKGFVNFKMLDEMKFKLVPQRIVQLMSLVVTQVTTEHEDLTWVGKFWK